MNVQGGPSTIGLQHMAARAQEARQARPSSPAAAFAASETAASGNNMPDTGESLPAATADASSAPQAEHATGLERAIEMLQRNSARNPEAKGLQQALEMLARNQERTPTVDVQA